MAYIPHFIAIKYTNVVALLYVPITEYYDDIRK